MRLVEVVGYEADEARISHFYKWERFKYTKGSAQLVWEGERTNNWQGGVRVRVMT